jgi:hypothetical protein
MGAIKYCSPDFIGLWLQLVDVMTIVRLHIISDKSLEK